jgi:hypothetical protein
MHLNHFRQLKSRQRAINQLTLACRNAAKAAGSACRIEIRKIRFHFAA